MSENNSSSNIYEKKSIQYLIVLFSFPTILSLILESLASMIDTAFAGHLGNMSANALSAMGILNPILLLLIAAQLIFGVSTSIVISKRIGEKDDQKINNTFKVGLYSSSIFGVVLSLLIYLFQDSLLNILGASGQVLVLAKQYLNVAIVFNIFSTIGYMLVNVIRVFGHPKMEIIIVAISTIINITFNVIFTYVYDMGILGIALSTLVSEVFYLGISVLYLLKNNLWIKKSKLDYREYTDIMISLIKIGFVQFLMQGLNSLSGFVINKMLIIYGNIAYVGAWSIVSNINMVILLPLIGFTQGAQSIVAYFHGSNNVEKKHIVKNKVLIYSLIYSISVTIIEFIFAKTTLEIFTNDTALVNLAIPIVRIVVAGFPFLGIIYTMITFMQVSGQESIASRLEVIRQIFVLIPLIIILPLVFSNLNIINVKPQIAIFLAIPISTIILVLMYSNKIATIIKE